MPFTNILFSVVETLPASDHDVLSGSSIFAEYVKILLPALLSYLITRYSIMKPQKRAIKEQQFELVYLPLYRLTDQYLNTRPVSQENLLLFTRKAEKLFYKNYSLVFPKTLRLFELLKYELGKDNINAYHISNFEYQVATDYEQLKRTLGYPTDSFIDSLKRLNKLDKVFTLFKGFLLFSIVLNLASVFLAIIEQRIFDSLILCFSLVFLGFVSYLVNYITRH